MKSLLSLDPAALIAYSLNIFLQVTVVCLVALFATRCVFRRDPATRYTVCLAALLCLLFSPLAVGLQSSMGYGRLRLTLPADFFTPPAPEAAFSSSRIEGARTQVEMRETADTSRWLDWAVWTGFFIWATGAAWGSVRFAWGCREISRLTDGLRPWNAAPHAEMLARIERLLGRPVPPIFTSPRILSPVVVGALHPRVLLPESLTETLSPTQLRQALLHECAHVVFRHTRGGVIERAVRVLFWLHPLVRPLCRELARAREEVCDNVASQEEGAACYARTLLAIAQGIEPAPHLSSALALQGPETSLEERITGLLDPRRNRMVRVKRWKLWAVTGAAVLAMASTALVRVVADEAKAKQAAAETSEAEAREQKLKAEAAVTIEARAKQLMATSSISVQAAHQQAETEYAATHHLPPAKPVTAAELAAHRKAEAEYIAKTLHRKVAVAKNAKSVKVTSADGKTRVVNSKLAYHAASASEAEAREVKMKAEANAKTQRFNVSVTKKGKTILVKTADGKTHVITPKLDYHATADTPSSEEREAKASEAAEAAEREAKQKAEANAKTP